MIKRQTKLLIIVGVAFVALAVLYFAVISPLINAKEEKPVPELIEGEVLGTNNTYMMMEHIENADIQRLEVHNSNGGYTFYRGKDDALYIEGLEGTPYSLASLSQVVVAAGYTLISERLMGDDLDLHEYGLADSDDPAWYEITTITGTKHKVYVGNAMVTGTGYYCRYDGRDAVYLIDNSMSVLLQHVYTLITPLIAVPVTATNYYTVDDLYIIRDNECVIWLDYMTPEEIETTAALGKYRFIYPTDYTPNLGSYGSMLETLSQIYGDEVVYAGPVSEEVDPQMLLDKFGINLEEPDYELHYTFNEVESLVTFSKCDVDGNMYAYSMLFNIVVKINIKAIPFLEWGLLQFVDNQIFSKNINDIASITIESDLVTETFRLEGSGDDLKIKADSLDRYFEGEDEIRNFKYFYQSNLMLYLEDYTESDDTENTPCIATITVVTDAGVETVYKYYAYSTRRCYYTVNGVGAFYTFRDDVEKVLNDTVRVLNFQPVSPDAKD